MSSARDFLFVKKNELVAKIFTDIMRAVAAVPTEGKRFLTHENKPPLSSKMKSRGS